MTYTSALRGTGNFLANCATTGRYRAGMQINRAIDDAFVGGKLNGSSIKVTITPKGGIEIPGVQTNRPYVYPVLWRLANVTGTRELDVSIDATFLDIGAMLNVARQEHFTAAEVAVRNNEPGISHGLETSIPYLSRILLRNIPAGLFFGFWLRFQCSGNSTLDGGGNCIYLCSAAFNRIRHH